MFQGAVRDFAESEVRPRVHAMEQAAQLDPALIPKFFELGLMGIEIPEAHGGARGRPFMTVPAVEELFRGAAPAPLLRPVAEPLGQGHCAYWAAGRPQRRVLPRL